MENGQAVELEKVRATKAYRQRKAQLANREWRLDNLYFIRSEQGERIPFVRNPAQQAFFNDMWLRNIIPKARKLGMSTFIELLMLDGCIFSSGKVCGIVDRSLDDAVDKLGMIAFAYDNMPEEIRKAVPLVRRADKYLEWANGSNVSVGTSYRGGTPAFLHVCLTGDTEIYTKNAHLKPIEEIEPGELVLTSKGRYRPVKAVIRNRLADLGVRLLEVSTFGCPNPLKITENHMIMVRNEDTYKPEWRAAGEVKRGDYIAFPLNEPSNNLRDGTIPFGSIRIVPDDNLGWLCGFYLAEGTTRKRHGKYLTDVSFSIDKDEVSDTLAAIHRLGLSTAHLKRGAKQINVYTHPYSRTRVITVNSKDFAEFLYDNFGEGDRKAIPDKIMKWGSAFIRGLIKGYFDGDGSYSDDHVVSAVSTRKQLIFQMRRLLMSMRFGVPAIYFAPASNRYGRNCKDAWTLKLGGSGNWKFRRHYGLPLPVLNTKNAQLSVAKGWLPTGRKFWRRGADHYWMRITGVKEIEPVEFVYDLALDVEPHDYVTVNGVVHNSEYGKISVDSPDTATEIKTGAITAVPMTGQVFVESTWHGTGGEFSKMTMAAKAQMDRHAQLTPLDFKFHFYGWWLKPDYRLANNLVIITQELREYFKDLEAKFGVKLDADQMAWYQNRYTDLGLDKTHEEFPSSSEELFLTSNEGAFFKREMSKARQDGRIGGLVPFDPTRRVNTFWDIGEDTTAIWWHQSDGLRHRVIDYYEEEGWSLQGACGMIDDKRRTRKFVYDKHYGPHDMGNKDWGNSAQTRKQTAKGLGVEITVVPRIDNKDDAIEAARRMINNMWFDAEHCSLGVERLENYHKKWNKALGVYTSEPEHDANSHCFVGETEILTSNGIERISNLPETGEVLTQCGLKPYRNPRITQKNAQLVEVTFSDGLMVKCTPEHLFLTAEGWKSASSLSRGSLIQSTLTQLPNISMAAYIKCGPANAIYPAPDDDYISMFGPLHLGRYQKAATSITKTMIGLITDSQIWNVSQRLSIYLSPGISERLKDSLVNLLQMPAFALPSGINLKQGDFGIVGMPDAQSHGKNGNEKLMPAIFAGQSLIAWFAKEATQVGFVPTPAGTLSIEGVRSLPNKQDVWCLTVPEGEQFSLANGAIVHNCADALQTGACGLVPDKVKSESRSRIGEPPRTTQWAS